MFLITLRTHYDLVILITWAQSLAQAVVFHQTFLISTLINFFFLRNLIISFFVINWLVLKTRRQIYNFRIHFVSKNFKIFPSGRCSRNYNKFCNDTMSEIHKKNFAKYKGGLKLPAFPLVFTEHCSNKLIKLMTDDDKYWTTWRRRWKRADQWINLELA